MSPGAGGNRSGRDEAPLLRAEGLTKHYDSNTGLLDALLGRSKAVRALDGVDLELYDGETLGIVGESGCGKTTLGRALLRLLEPTAGSVYYRQRTDDGSRREIDLTAVSKRRLRELRTDLQYVFQDPFSSLNPRLTVGELVGEPLAIHDLASGRARTERVCELLELVGLNASHADRFPDEFSGGQRQRIGIARALAVDPALIVFDEPVSALDVSVQAQILTLLEDLQVEFGLSYIFIGHDLRVIEHVADRVAVMYLGEVVENGPTEAVFEPPHHPYVEALLSAIPEPDPRWEGDRIRLPGTVPSPIDPPAGCRFHTRCSRIIPPETYDLGEETWRAMRAFKVRLDAVASVESLLEGGGSGRTAGSAETGRNRTADRDELSRAQPADRHEPDPDECSGSELDELVRRTFDVPTPIPDPAADERFSAVIDRLHEGDLSAAAETFEAAFSSPCERRNPALRSVEDRHEIACLLYDESDHQPNAFCRPERTE